MIKNVVLTALVNDGKILLLERNKPPFDKHWGFPGGKLEFLETVEKAALREFFEETNIKANFDSLRGIATEFIEEENGEKLHSQLFICQLSADEHDFKISREGKLRWFDLKNLDKEKIIPSDYLMIKEFILKDNPIKMRKIRIAQKGDSYEIKHFGD